MSKWQIQPNVLSAEDLAEQLLLYVILKNTDLALVYRDKIDSVGFMSKFRGEIYEGLLKQLDAGVRVLLISFLQNCQMKRPRSWRRL